MYIIVYNCTYICVWRTSGSIWSTQAHIWHTLGRALGTKCAGNGIRVAQNWAFGCLRVAFGCLFGVQFAPRQFNPRGASGLNCRGSRVTFIAWLSRVEEMITGAMLAHFQLHLAHFGGHLAHSSSHLTHIESLWARLGAHFGCPSGARWYPHGTLWAVCRTQVGHPTVANLGGAGWQPLASQPVSVGWWRVTQMQSYIGHFREKFGSQLAHSERQLGTCKAHVCTIMRTYDHIRMHRYMYMILYDCICTCIYIYMII